MYLQLAENRRRGKVSVSGYYRSPGVSSHKRRYPSLSEPAQSITSNPYIFVPDFEAETGGVYIREDKFDSMPDKQWAVFMKTLAPYQPEVQQRTLSEPMFLASRADRKERRKRKKEAKVQKKEAKVERRKQKTESKRLKAESKAALRKAKGEAKMAKATGGGGGIDWGKVKDVGGGLISKFTGKGGEEETPEGGGAETPFYKNPVVIGGAVLLTAGAIYMATRKTA
ncbi:hypothetical protein [Flavobacterium sp.]|uniref:hypothetical protein n=1 Tax=Flavobacterium sp. TaxID=239 RepID=UPI002B4B0E77|nr:hypothetical protein [Flavobacterium sp.]HLF52332.1 hypothetical protein [Flavobacterium sp.]